MGKCTSTPRADKSLHEEVYYIDASSHRVLFFTHGCWTMGVIRDNVKKKYVVVYEKDNEWAITTLPKKKSAFVSSDLWDMYARNEIDLRNLSVASF